MDNHKDKDVWFIGLVNNLFEKSMLMKDQFNWTTTTM